MGNCSLTANYSIVKTKPFMWNYLRTITTLSSEEKKFAKFGKIILILPFGRKGRHNIGVALRNI